MSYFWLEPHLGNQYLVSAGKVPAMKCGSGKMARRTAMNAEVITFMEI